MRSGLLYFTGAAVLTTAIMLLVFHMGGVSRSTLIALSVWGAINLLGFVATYLFVGRKRP